MEKKIDMLRGGQTDIECVLFGARRTFLNSIISNFPIQLYFLLRRGAKNVTIKKNLKKKFSFDIIYIPQVVLG